VIINEDEISCYEDEEEKCIEKYFGREIIDLLEFFGYGNE
jgi:hypothetical protein